MEGEEIPPVKYDEVVQRETIGGGHRIELQIEDLLIKSCLKFRFNKHFVFIWDQ